MPVYLQDGKVLTENGKIAVSSGCCCRECCCIGTSAITLGLDGITPNGETCQEVVDVDTLEEDCADEDAIARPAESESCSGATAVVEWCDLSVTLECGVSGETTETRDSENSPLDLPPYLCTADGANITRILLSAKFASSLVNPLTTSRSGCRFGCNVECNRCVIRFSFILYDSPAVGAARFRKYYVTQRSGCDESPIIETVIDDGNYCCPEDAEVTVTFAP